VLDLGARQSGPGPRVTVVVGTDHHPFDRLVGWVNTWLGQHPEQTSGFFVQAGTASVRPACPWSAALRTDELSLLLDSTDVLVCHGGPASIADGWSRGQVPIVVPRLHRLGEHVDDHQLDFAVKIAELGRIRLARTGDDFAALLEEAAHDIGGFRASGLESECEAAIARFSALVDGLGSGPLRAGRHRQRRWRAASSAPAGAAADVLPGASPVPRTTRNGTIPRNRGGLG
jgi:UDP-N-acetylglucosamine transferase subunit ALG13